MFIVEKYFESWDPKIHGPRNYLQSFYVAAFVDECGTNNHCPLEIFRNGISKNTRSSDKGTINNGSPSSYSDCEMGSKIKKRFLKNCHATFDKKMKFNCHALKFDDDYLFKNSSKKIPTFVTSPFLTMLNVEVGRISLQQLEYEMNRTGYPADYNFFEIGYCVHPNFPYTNIQLEQASDLILSRFHKEDHSFIYDTLKNKKTQFFYLYYIYKPNKNASRTDITDYDEMAYKYVPTYGDESTGYHRHMISVVVFFYSNTLKIMLLGYAVTEMGCFDDYSDAAPRAKTMRVNGITKFLLHVAQFITFSQTNIVTATLIYQAQLNSLYPRLGFKVIKDFATSPNFEEALYKFHYESGK